MSWFNFFTQEIAIDLGTANTLIIHNDKVVVDEPSIVAIDRTTGKVIAVGRQAQQMHGKTHENIKTIRPLRDGVIADFKAAEDMIKGMIRMIKPGRQLFTPNLRMVICIPSGITEVEKRAVKDSSEHAGAKEVYLIHEPMAAAIGIGIDVEEPMGNMIIDIGGGTSEIAVIALGGIVCDKNIRVAGDEFTNDIEEYMRRQHNILVGERTAEQIKIEVGAAMTELDNPPPDYAVRGRDLMTGIPKEITVTYSEIAQALDKSDQQDRGGHPQRVGGHTARTERGHLQDRHLPGRWWCLAARIGQAHQHQDQVPVHVSEDPLRAVARGTGIALKNIDRFQFLMRE
jgi:rod shape-determining protein MreB